MIGFRILPKGAEWKFCAMGERVPDPLPAGSPAPEAGDSPEATPPSPSPQAHDDVLGDPVPAPSADVTPPGVEPTPPPETVEIKAERLEKELQDAQSQLGRQSTELNSYKEFIQTTRQQPQAPPQQVQPPGQPRPFMTEAEEEAFLLKPSQFMNRAVEGIQRQVSQEIQRSITQHDQSSRQLQQVRDMFYAANPDLVGHDMLVGAVTERIQREYPGMPLQSTLTLVAEQTRQQMNAIRESGPPGGVDGVPQPPNASLLTPPPAPQRTVSQNELDKSIDFADGKRG